MHVSILSAAYEILSISSYKHWGFEMTAVPHSEENVRVTTFFGLFID